MSKIIKENSGIDPEELKKIMEPGRIVKYTTPPVKELKYKKDIPTVIEYQGRRYVLDHANNRK